MEGTKISSLLLLIIILGFTSCRTTYKISTIELELIKPGQLTLPEDIDTFAVFKRGFFDSDSINYEYTSGSNYKLLTDTSIHYNDLSNLCADNLAHYLENENYFLKVISYSDSMNYSFKKADSLTTYSDLHKKLDADAFLFLDFFRFEDQLAKYTPNDNFFFIQDAFPELKKSKQFEFVNANLIWNLFIKGDSISHVYFQVDQLYYGNSVNPEYFGNSFNHKQLLENASIYLGNSFGTKLLPSWQKVDRIYYHSKNVNMLKAEQFILNGDWLKAAEIYHLATSNKNRNIEAKAKFNMALVCEMEGNLDAALDWLLLSHTVYKYKNPDHEFNCDQYSKILELRKKEIERLAIQVRPNGEN